jgi:hypothetical protein
MNTPGFTAETSVYRTSNSYRSSAGSGAAAGLRLAFIRGGRCAQICCTTDPSTGDVDCDDGCMRCCRHPSPANCQ